MQVAYIKEISDNYAGFKFMVKSDKQEEEKAVENIEEHSDDINEEEIYQQILEMSRKEFEQTEKKKKDEEIAVCDRFENIIFIDAKKSGNTY